jgi:hypothetical protein
MLPNDPISARPMPRFGGRLTIGIRERTWYVVGQIRFVFGQKIDSVEPSATKMAAESRVVYSSSEITNSAVKIEENKRY